MIDRLRPGERLSVLGGDGELTDVTEDLHRFMDALEAMEADEAAGAICGDPDAEVIARRAALGGTDPVSVAVAAIDRRMWDQEGRRGFRASITRWRFAALIFIRWLTGGWMSLAPAPAEVVPPVVPAPELVTWRKVRDRVTDRMTVGPPAVVAVPEVPVIDP
jgi:hypothetical protein